MSEEVKPEEVPYYFEVPEVVDAKPHIGQCVICMEKETLVQDTCVGIACFGASCRLLVRNVKQVRCAICKAQVRATKQEEHAQSCMERSIARSATRRGM